MIEFYGRLSLPSTKEHSSTSVLRGSLLDVLAFSSTLRRDFDVTEQRLQESWGLLSLKSSQASFKLVITSCDASDAEHTHRFRNSTAAISLFDRYAHFHIEQVGVNLINRVF
ncbi:hypothetical protein KP509_06G043100 [Ceratopteris richardii]|uniref:Uncharacterized protein n=1 Tax=Ceratopteris richardii TaxID=49495 RepID=A0A8T2UHK8_CERRI|nr:hypothetical protein KP509_06G043100 [Ceratopteris richardii]